MPHLLFDISGHGYGHLAQILPVLSQIHQDHPSWRLTVRCRHPRALLDAWLPAKTIFATDAPPPEAEMAMQGPAAVDVPASLAAYQKLHQHWDDRLKEEQQRLAALAPDLVISNIAYSSLAAASRLDMPALALCSLDWASIFQAYCLPQPQSLGGTDKPHAQEILAQIQEAYQQAAMFLQLTPHLPMTYLGAKRRPIGPIGRVGENRKHQILETLGLPPDQRLILMCFGGIRAERPLLERLPTIPKASWLLTRSLWKSYQEDAPDRQDLYAYDHLDLPFIDLVASSDLAISKTGYGFYVEAALNRCPLIGIERPDWPEEPFLRQWAQQNNHFTPWSLRGHGGDPKGQQDFVTLVTDMLEKTSYDSQLLSAPQSSGIQEALTEIKKWVV